MSRGAVSFPEADIPGSLPPTRQERPLELGLGVEGPIIARLDVGMWDVKSLEIFWG